jgi:hypothetical protein
MPLLTKRLFLQALDCDRRGWLLRSPEGSAAPLGFEEQFRFAQGNAVGDLARTLLGPGLDLRGAATPAWVEQGRTALADTRHEVLFEVPVATSHAMARPDMLQRLGTAWRLVEVKSAKAREKIKPEYIDDVGYTIAVALGAGLSVAQVELALVNPDWRVDNDAPALVLQDVTAEALARGAEFAGLLESVWQAVFAVAEPEPVLKSACRKCEFLRVACFQQGPPDPVFELPRITEKRVNQWLADGITRITELGSEEPLSATQALHRRAVLEGHLVTVPDGLARLDRVAEPAAYLDFETLSLAFPPFPGVAPYDTIPIQFSVHRRVASGQLEHYELLLDPAAPDLDHFARCLVDSLDGAASIVVYSHFEQARLKWLAGHLPHLADELEGVISRLVDLLPIVTASVAHPAFHGSLSIKKVLPVLVPASLLTYHGLVIGNGGDAAGVVGLRALGRVDDAQWAAMRDDLLHYCAVDTEAMVRLHDGLLALR